jgi:cellulose synthase/poly-beta-1,6-N-acetylglucosamine synthase-like glycosyltransferase
MGWPVSFWALVATLAAVYFGYPLALFLLSRRSRPGPQDGPSDDDLPSLTILVPAYDEEGVIATKLRNILDLDYPPDRLSALVISDASGDGTYEAACRELESESEEDRARIRIVRNPTRTGKTVALSRWAPEATGEILLFTDANALYRRDAARRLAAHFREPTVGLVCGRLRYVDDPGRGASAENLYWRYEDAIKGWEGQLGRLLVANGSIYAVRREHFEEMPGSVADDFVVPLVTFQKGVRLVYEPGAVAEERPPIRAAEDFRSKARIVTRGLEAVLRYRARIVASGPLRVTQYVLHKVLRWLAPLLLIALVAASLGGRRDPLIAAALLAQIVFYLLAVWGLLVRDRPEAPTIVRIPFHFCLTNAAALKGLVDFLARRERAVWEKSASTRRG